MNCAQGEQGALRQALRAALPRVLEQLLELSVWLAALLITALPYSALRRNGASPRVAVFTPWSLPRTLARSKVALLPFALLTLSRAIG